MVICTKENLLKGLSIVERATGKNPTLPILSHVAFNIMTGKIILSATDLDIAVTVSVPAKTDRETAFTLPLRALLGFVSSIPHETIQFTRDGKKITIKSGSFKSSFQSGSFDEFPIIPELETNNAVRIDGGQLSRALQQVAVASAQTETRPELTGILLGIEGGQIQFAATDTFRLSLRAFSYTQPEIFSCILPYRAALEVSRVFQDGEVMFQANENQCVFKSTSVVFISRLIDGTFPDFRVIIPKTTQTTITVPKEELLSKLEAASYFASRLNDILLKFKVTENRLELSAENPDIGSYENEVSGTNTEGEDQDIAVNLRYLFDGIRHINEKQCVLACNGAAQPLVLRAEKDQENLYLLMPIRK